MVAAKKIIEVADALGIIRQWGSVYTLTATHCACCGIGLRDALSVSRGIGPECSRKHYEIDFPITQDMIEVALGHLFSSGLADPVKIAAKALKHKPRDLCNILLWWSSAHLDQVEVVLDCAKVVSALGFTTLGERLRERNTDVILSSAADGSGDFILRCRAKSTVRYNMGRVKEATRVGREGRFKFGWRFPAARKDLVWTILGEDFGNQWATVPPSTPDGTSQVVKIPARTGWDVRAAFRLAYPPDKVAPQKPQVVRVGLNGWLEIHTPHRNFGFISELKNTIPTSDRSWSFDKMCWSVRMFHEKEVRAMVAKHFNGAV